MMKNTIFKRDFKERLNWNREELEESYSYVNSLNNQLINKLLEFNSVIDFYFLENQIWNIIRKKYSNPIYPEYHIKIISVMTKKEKDIYFKNKNKADLFFLNKSLEFKILFHKKLLEIKHTIL